MKIQLEVVKGPHKGKSFEFDGHDTFLVGRGAKAHFQLPRKDVYFSRSHFMVEVNPPNCRILDLNSRNGTYVNRQKVHVADLNDGDLIRGGKTMIRVKISEPVEASSTDDVVRPEDDQFATLKPSSTPSAAELEISGDKESRDTLNDPKDLLPSDYKQRIDALPQPIPGYSLVDQIGHGGMGEVWLALCERDQSVAAIKTILPQVACTPRDRELFLREADILGSLNHPRIVQFREMGDAGGMLFFAMEYIPGCDAGRLLKQEGKPLSVDRAVSIVCQLLEALEYAHSLRFVHRDIKPANLLVSGTPGEERVKVADFGLARVYQDSKLSGLTMTNQIGGTMQFMPPEQITDYRNVSPAADQYSAAATLYYLLTGQFIFDFKAGAGPNDLADRFLKILYEPPVPIHKWRRGIPDELNFVLQRALAKEPGDRFASVAELKDSLNRLICQS